MTRNTPCSTPVSGPFCGLQQRCAKTDNAQAESRVDELKAHFDEAQIVEIAFAITTLHGMNMFNNMFHIEPEETPMVSYTGVAHDSAGAAADSERIAS